MSNVYRLALWCTSAWAHGFKNPGSIAVTFMEIFVKNTGRAGNISPQTIQAVKAFWESELWLRKTVR